MDIIKYGTSVVIKHTNITGQIIQTLIRQTEVSYEVAYFIGGDYKSAWLNESQFDCEKPQKESIGFK